MNNTEKIPYFHTKLTDGFWAQKQALNRDTTVFAVRDRFEETGRFEAFKCLWDESKEDEGCIRPHIFWDSDIAKWIESVAYIIQAQGNDELESKVDEVVELIEKNRGDDGYFNIYFTVCEPDNRWCVRDAHELYCAGHLMEAAVAYYEATGKKKFLDIMCDYADYIEKVFKTDDSAEFSTPGHEEIELALVRLYHATGEKRYLELSKFFIDKRGTSEKDAAIFSPEYNQSHLPVRLQKTAEGHCVRACYLYSAMADLAKEYNDKELFDACCAIFDNMTQRRMYVTGGLGSTREGERFTVDYDLPNATAYAETCAAISLAMFAGRMLQISQNSKYADIAELVMYNGFLSGMSLDGKSFFYENPLEIDLQEREFKKAQGKKEKYPITQRVEVFNCSCCPPNVTRFIASIGDYLYSKNDSTLWVHQYMSADTSVNFAGKETVIKQRTSYPDSGKINLAISNPPKQLALRIPGWCDSFSVMLDGEEAEYTQDKGYIYIKCKGDAVAVTLNLFMEASLIAANPKVRADCLKSAVRLGPVIYCAEGVDNGENLSALKLHVPLKYSECRDAQLGCKVLDVEGYSFDSEHFDGLYNRYGTAVCPKTIRLIPYYAFANRGETDMRVWLG
ncbi:MAG: glycoside hydrolase family 127 protein [Clostridiales bacterium]|nr:glycoside hydrolase family 127 protein [Clostridiales bacterium]